MIAMENTDLNDTSTFLIVRDNSDLHDPSTSFSYLNPRLGAYLDINDTEYEPELEQLEVQPRSRAKNPEYSQFKEYTDFSTAHTDLKSLGWINSNLSGIEF